MKALLASFLAATLSSASLAATISFPGSPVIPPNDPPWSFGIIENFVDSGFRFSPDCHLDFLYAMDCGGSGSFNNFDNYLGPSRPGIGNLYIDFVGKPFSLISVDPLDIPSCEGCGGPFDISVQSDKGGLFTFSDATEVFFTGDEWSNVTWLIVSNNGGQPMQGFSNLVVSVSIPEPAPLPLIVLALIGLAFIRRPRHQRVRAVEQLPPLVFGCSTASRGMG